MKFYVRTAVIMVLITSVFTLLTLLIIKASWISSNSLVGDDLNQHSSLYQMFLARKLGIKRKFTRRHSYKSRQSRYILLTKNLSVMRLLDVTTARDMWTLPNLGADQIQAVIGKVEDMCKGNFIGYNRSFALLKNVSVDPKFGHGRKGGENIPEVINQREDLEYYTLEKGYFKLRCQEVDGHPAGALDGTWSRLFGGMIRAGEITEAVTFPSMVWSTIGYDSMLNSHRLHQVPFLEEFRSFFLLRHSVHFNDALDCDNLTVVLLLRKDYIAHPRNPSGLVSRKIENDKELVQSLKEFLPRHNVLCSQIDLLSMKDQLTLISRTDILIGMHGAGLTHTLFLPKHAGLIELYPNYWPTANVHFQAMARWRNLKYLQWQNTDPSNERANKYTVINTNDVVEMVEDIHALMCN
ncbi:uncharacterized protein LOC128218417 [Mya arenaria]|uniref:uncharacterized protein LOC128218417 n=1 Tax=Mya arenaria TaxID=6604 RepID=UPI0022E6462B|nr:uncharacterized protein LOC128218417 [Mya arenaria]